MEGVNNDYSWLSFPTSQPMMPRIHRVQFASTPRSTVGENDGNYHVGQPRQQANNNLPDGDDRAPQQAEPSVASIPEAAEISEARGQGISGGSENNTAELLERNIESQNVLVDMIRTLNRRIEALERNVVDSRPGPSEQPALGPRNERPSSAAMHSEGRCDPTILHAAPTFVNNPPEPENFMRFTAPNFTATVPPRLPQAYSTAFGDPTYAIYHPIGAPASRFAGLATGFSTSGHALNAGWPGGSVPTGDNGLQPSFFSTNAGPSRNRVNTQYRDRRYGPHLSQ